MQKTSVPAFMSKYCRYTIYQQNFADIILWQHCKIHRSISSLNTLAFGRKRGFSKKKNNQTHMALRGNYSVPVQVTDLIEVSKGAASHLVRTRKKFFCSGVQIFCDWRHKWRTFRPPWPTLPGPGRQSYMVVFCWSFYWKLDYNPSLLILWMTCWGFGFKSYDLN